MDFTGLLFLGFLWFVFNVLTKGREQGRSRPLPRTPAPGGGDATQREGSALERLLREMERSLSEAAGTQASDPKPAARPGGPMTTQVPPRRPAATLPSAEEVEDRESLETEEQVVSLEQEVKRPARIRVDHDDQAEQLVARRIAAARAREGAHTRADHAGFDARIRAQPADATAVRALTPEQLRRAVVWREILGPPVALREPEG